MELRELPRKSGSLEQSGGGAPVVYRRAGAERRLGF
jgi:hypothetical protein